MPFPSPDTQHPVVLPDGQPHLGTVFLKPAVSHPRIEVGDYTYASAHTPPADWARLLAPYLYPSSNEWLRIGRFCQIADGVQFITASANHRHDGHSTYPFAIFDGGIGDPDRPSLPAADRSVDTVVGHDVWFGTGATVLPGAQIGNGVIVSAGAVVRGIIPSYCYAFGNPVQTRPRFDRQTIAALEAVAWWDWPIADILAHEAAICGNDLAALERHAQRVAATVDRGHL